MTNNPRYRVRRNGRAQDGRAKKPENMWVRSGKTAVMVFEGELIRMTLPVMCLQSGGQGQRVESEMINRETKKTYLARVTGVGVVTSVLSD